MGLKGLSGRAETSPREPRKRPLKPCLRLDHRYRTNLCPHKSFDTNFRFGEMSLAHEGSTSGVWPYSKQSEYDRVRNLRFGPKLACPTSKPAKEVEHFVPHFCGWISAKNRPVLTTDIHELRPDCTPCISPVCPRGQTTLQGYLL